MNKETKEKAQKVLASPMFLFFFFLFLVFVFSEFREGIARLNASCLLLTGEIAAKESTGEGEMKFSPTAFAGGMQPSLKRKKAKAKAKKTAARGKIDYSKPEYADFPKTAPIKALFIKDDPDPHSEKYPLFPPMRKFAGDNWNKEKTETRMATDGKKLYVFIKCFDQDPDNYVTKYTEGEKNLAFKDDSIEFFLMRDRETVNYIQYICSVSGKTMIFYQEETNKYGGNKGGDRPEDFKEPRIFSEKKPWGFEIVMVIHLSNIGLSEVEPGDGFLVQIVRNYRGQGDEGSVCLQLFPSAIYSDKRLGMNNHDRRGFQPIEIISE